MTTAGGTNSKGVIFRISKDGASYKKLHDFTSAHGANPTGALLLSEDFFQPAVNTTDAVASVDVRNQTSYSVGVYPNPFIRFYGRNCK